MQAFWSRKGIVDLQALLRNVLEKLTPQAQTAGVITLDQDLSGSRNPGGCREPDPGIRQSDRECDQVFQPGWAGLCEPAARRQAGRSTCT